jgi:hypothetical protein
MADEYFEQGLSVLRRGGAFVHYGSPQSFAGFLRLVAKLIWFSLLPNGKSIKGLCATMGLAGDSTDRHGCGVGLLCFTRQAPGSRRLCACS